MPGSQVVQSVVRAAAILRVVGAASDGVTLQHLAQAVGLKAPTTHQLARTLIAEGLLEKRESPTRYCIGQTLFDLVHMQAEARFVHRAETTLLALARLEPEVVFTLAEFREHNVVATLRLSPAQPGVIERRENHAMAPYSSASALTFQAFWPTEMREAFRSRYPIDEYGMLWRNTRELDRFLEFAREQGMVIRPAEGRPNVAMAMPVTRDGHIIAALGASWNPAPLATPNPQRPAGPPGPPGLGEFDDVIRRVAERLRAAGNELSSPTGTAGQTTTLSPPASKTSRSQPRKGVRP